jgi:hypothetical protein
MKKVSRQDRQDRQGRKRKNVKMKFCLFFLGDLGERYSFSSLLLLLAALCIPLKGEIREST